MHKKYINDELVTITDSEYNKFENERKILRDEMKNLEQAKTNTETKKASGKQKLLDLGLSEEEIKSLLGV